MNEMQKTQFHGGARGGLTINVMQSQRERAVKIMEKLAGAATLLMEAEAELAALGQYASARELHGVMTELDDLTDYILY
jgi:hypothetical protein